MLTATVTGNVGQDAVVREAAGKKVMNFSVAHSERYKDKNGDYQERTTWVKVDQWGTDFPVAKFLVKGARVVVSGTPSTDSYTDKQGETKTNLKITIRNFQDLWIASSPAFGTGEKSEAKPKITQEQGSELLAAEEDLPF